MRVNGRTLRPSTLAERRFMISLGATALHVPRGTNPFTAARRLGRAARGVTPDHDFARALAARMKKREPAEIPLPSPDGDRPAPVTPDPAAEHGAAA